VMLKFFQQENLVFCNDFPFHDWRPVRTGKEDPGQFSLLLMKLHVFLPRR
jgi:hypothetical protein